VWEKNVECERLASSFLATGGTSKERAIDDAFSARDVLQRERAPVSTSPAASHSGGVKFKESG
jgi:hypothetical protein